MDEENGVDLPRNLPEDRAEGREDAIARIYVGLLGRAPDDVEGDNPEGLSFWVNELDNRGDKSFAQALYHITESIRVGAPDSQFDAAGFDADAKEVLNADGLEDLGSDADAKITSLVAQLASNVGGIDATALPSSAVDLLVGAVRTDLSNGDGASIGKAVAQIHFLEEGLLPGGAAATISNRVEAAKAFAANQTVQDRSGGSQSEVNTVVQGGTFTQTLGADADAQQEADDAANNLPEPTTATVIDEGGTVTATDGEADVFAINIDSTGGDVVAADLGADTATIEGFDGSEDTLRFVETASDDAATATADSIASGDGFTLTENQINSELTFSFAPNENNEAGELRVEGVGEASTDFIELGDSAGGGDGTDGDDGQDGDDGTDGDDGEDAPDAGETLVDSAETFDATDGEAETFVFNIDSSGGDVVAGDLGDGTATIAGDGFNPDEGDTLRFVDTASSDNNTATADSIANGDGFTLTENQINSELTFSFAPDDNNDAGELRIQGVGEASTDFIEVA